MADDPAGGEVAEAGRLGEAASAHHPVEEAGGEQVAGTGKVGDRLHRGRRHRLHLVRGHHQRAVGADRHRRDRSAFGLQRPDRGVEVGGLV